MKGKILFPYRELTGQIDNHNNHNNNQDNHCNPCHHNHNKRFSQTQVMDGQ